ncbi:MAG: hypothetical protein ACI8ZN_001798 [Bacteroidia bacterium]|jgi:hypothetical protein
MNDQIRLFEINRILGWLISADASYNGCVFTSYFYIFIKYASIACIKKVIVWRTQ